VSVLFPRAWPQRVYSRCSAISPKKTEPHKLPFLCFPRNGGNLFFFTSAPRKKKDGRGKRGVCRVSPPDATGGTKKCNCETAATFPVERRVQNEKPERRKREKRRQRSSGTERNGERVCECVSVAAFFPSFPPCRTDRNKK